MAITDKEQGVWNLEEVYNKINEGGIWSYTGDNQLWVSGGGNGHLGMNENIRVSSPVQLTGNYTNAAFGNSVLGIRADGTLWAWGANGYGTLGNNKYYGVAGGGNYSSPIQVGAESTWALIASRNNDMVFATKTDGTLWSWGYNWSGALGHNKKLSDLTGFSSPTQVGTDTDWPISNSDQLVTTGWLWAIKQDGTLWACGDGTSGMLGQNNNTSRSSPVQVGTDTTWDNICETHHKFHAIKTDGTLWACGQNQYGELGTSDKTSYSSPRQVPGTTWKTAAGFDNGTMAVKTNGTLWAWGKNSHGQQGRNNQFNSIPQCNDSPIQVGTNTNWDQVRCSSSSTWAIKTDGTLWAWGNNPTGFLGHNNRAEYSSPTQVGTLTNWTPTGFTNTKGFSPSTFGAIRAL